MYKSTKDTVRSKVLTVNRQLVFSTLHHTVAPAIKITPGPRRKSLLHISALVKYSIRAKKKIRKLS